MYPKQCERDTYFGCTTHSYRHAGEPKPDILRGRLRTASDRCQIANSRRVPHCSLGTLQPGYFGRHPRTVRARAHPSDHSLDLQRPLCAGPKGGNGSLASKGRRFRVLLRNFGRPRHRGSSISESPLSMTCHLLGPLLAGGKGARPATSTGRVLRACARAGIRLRRRRCAGRLAHERSQ